MRSRRRWLFAGLLLLVAVGVEVYLVAFKSSIKIDRDRGPRFHLDPNQPYEITFGEGWHPYGGGKRTTISHEGHVRMARSTNEYKQGTRSLLWEQTTFTLPHEAMTGVPGIIDSTGVLELHASYVDTNTFDGKSLYLWLKQGERTKKVSCRQYFPKELVGCIDQFTTLISKHGTRLKWEPAPEVP